MTEVRNMSYVGAGGPDDGPVGSGGRDADQARRRVWIAAWLITASLLFLLARAACRPRDRLEGAQSFSQRMERAAAEMGRRFALERPGARLLLITEPRASGNYSEALVVAARKGLRAGCGKSCRIQAEDSPSFDPAYLPGSRKLPASARGDDSHWLPSLEYWFVPDALCRLLEKHRDCDVAVSLAGLPIQNRVPELPATSAGRPMQLAVLWGDLGPPLRIAAYQGRGVLTHAVLWAPENAAWVRRDVLNRLPPTDRLPFCVFLTPASLQMLLRPATGPAGNGGTR